LPSVVLLCFVVSTYGAAYYGVPQPIKRYSYRLIGKPYKGVPPRPLKSYIPYQPSYQPSRTSANAIGNSPLGLTVDFDSSFGSFPLSSKNELTRQQRGILLPVMEALLKVMKTDKPSIRDLNKLMILTRDLLKTVPEGEMPNLRQYGFDVDSIPLGIDLDTLKNVALPETGDVIVIENGQAYVNTAFGSFPISELSLMTDAERETFLPAIKGFINLLKKDYLNPSETKELLSDVRKLDTWNLFPFDVRGSNEPKKKQGSGSNFNLSALGGLIGGLMNASTNF